MSYIYRTGDLARWLPDGNIQFLGRIDHQVKIRGYRIELEEIQSTIKSHPAVKDAVVILRDEDIGIQEEFSSIPLDEADRFIEKIKKSNPGKIREYLEKNNYKLTLEIKNDTFINPPQSHQRNWLIQRLKDEYEDDLIHLDKLTQRFVTGSQRKEITMDWKTTEAVYDGSQLIIDDQQVMQDWERPLMKRMAQIAAETHGDILEVGFGMGISATYMLEMGVRSYTVIECNDDVVKQFEAWRSQYPRVKIRLIHGRWQDVLDQLEMYDAIFFDTYHTSEEEFIEHVVKDITFAEHFFPTAAKHLRQGGIFTYYTNEIDTFSRRHQRLVFKYFDTLTLEVVKPLHPPADCNYWWADSMVVVKAVKLLPHQDLKEIHIDIKKQELAAKENNYQLTLEIKNDTFINPPQSHQRNWLLQQLKDELKDDLNHLDKLTQRFVVGSQRKEITTDWKTSEALYDGSQLIIDDQQVMQDWERPLMKQMAQIAAETHGDVLEVGFGMGISATYLLEMGVRSYTIIECNDDVIKQFEAWRSQYPQEKIRFFRGKWQDVLEQLEMYDAIFFDTYNLNEEEFIEHVLKDITFARHFFPTAAKHLRQGGIFTYYTNEIDTFSRRHQRLVFKYFDALTLEVVKPLHPPADCHYWWADSMVAVKAVKLHTTSKSTELPECKEIDLETRLKGLSPQHRKLMAQSMGLKAIRKEMNKTLVAYQVMKEGEDLKVEDLRGFLEKKLPDYMIPSYFVFLDQLPLTPGGKIDRKALPAPGKVPAGEYIAPRDVVEEKMAFLWSEVLEINKDLIGIDHNFFQLGGHSIKVTILIAKIHKEFKVKIPLARLFKTPNIRGLSQYIKEAGKHEYTPIEPIEIKEHYELAHAQKRLWILDRVEKEQIAYNIPGYYEFENLNREAFEKAIKTLFKRHEILRTTFITVNGEPRQKIHDEDSRDFKAKYLDLRKNQNRYDMAKKQSEEESTTPFNLETGPLLRTTLIHIDENRYLFLFTMHHIISDGWSLDILINEFVTLYDSFNKEKNNPLAPLKIQYKDYTCWHNRQLSGEKLTAHRDYWLNQFKGEIPYLKLPLDYPRPRLKSFAGEYMDFSLNKEITEHLKRIGREEGTTLFMIFLTLVNVLLYRYTRQTDIILGVTAAGREHEDLKNQIGFYVNMLAMRNQLKKGMAFKELLQSIKQNALQDFEHQVYPFDRLVQELNLVRDLSRNPLFDVVVTVLTDENQPQTGNTTLEHLNTPGETVTQYSPDSGPGAGKHDLRFRFADTYNQIFVNIQYNPLLFKKEKIKIMKERLVNLIQGIIANVDENIDNLSFLSETEKKQAKDRFQGGF
jgi:spermidine synthase/acyl carrier protein